MLAVVSESIAINSYIKWEQALRIFSDIYTRAHPHKSTELIQYNHVIHSISLTFIWDNVYAYDKEFRLHVSKYPQRNWGVILQQAWSMKLRDRISGGNFRNNGTSPSFSPAGSGGVSRGGKVNEPCRKFNKGRCKFGASCRYDHRCSYCHKFGHNVLSCHKLIADRERSASSSKRENQAIGNKTNSQSTE